jgi:DNA-dependent RNA polymerase auxiliary subunit epsilon
MSAVSLEIKFTNVCYHVVYFTHMNDEFLLYSLSVVNLEIVQEFVRHRDKCFFGPREEPINIASTENARELLSSESEFNTDR